MKTRDKLLTAFFLGGAAVCGIAAANHMIKKKAISGDLLKKNEGKSFPYRLGKIFYTKIGTGSPLLLIHDLRCDASGDEWSRVAPELSRNHTVYIPDLIGCGRSDKPAMTYTNYLYVSMISEFVRSVIGEKTDVICTGSSIPLIVMAATANPDLYGKLIFVSPEPVSESLRTPEQKQLFFRKIMDLPILGTLIYNIAVCRQHLAEKIALHDFFSPYSLPESVLNSRCEAAHLGFSPKSLYACIYSCYICSDFRKQLAGLKNEILLLSGIAVKDQDHTSEEYFTLNKTITCSTIARSKRFPHIENPEDFMEECREFL